MCVSMKPGSTVLPSKLDNFGFFAYILSSFLVGAYKADSVAFYCDGLRFRHLGVHGVDVSFKQNQIRKVTGI